METRAVNTYEAEDGVRVWTVALGILPISFDWIEVREKRRTRTTRY
jgi:hypothetical protein